MKASELLAAYAAGERDFRGADLAGADLSRANLANADLAGADLSRANLANADLEGADLPARLPARPPGPGRAGWAGTPDDLGVGEGE